MKLRRLRHFCFRKFIGGEKMPKKLKPLELTRLLNESKTTTFLEDRPLGIEKTFEKEFTILELNRGDQIEATEAECERWTLLY